MVRLHPATSATMDTAKLGNVSFVSSWAKRAVMPRTASGEMPLRSLSLINLFDWNAALDQRHDLVRC